MLNIILQIIKKQILIEYDNLKGAVEYLREILHPSNIKDFFVHVIGGHLETYPILYRDIVTLVTTTAEKLNSTITAGVRIVNHWARNTSMNRGVVALARYIVQWLNKK